MPQSGQLNCSFRIASSITSLRNLLHLPLPVRDEAIVFCLCCDSLFVFLCHVVVLCANVVCLLCCVWRVCLPAVAVWWGVGLNPGRVAVPLGSGPAPDVVPLGQALGALLHPWALTPGYEPMPLPEHQQLVPRHPVTLARVAYEARCRNVGWFMRCPYAAALIPSCLSATGCRSTSLPVAFGLLGMWCTRP